MNVQLVSKFAGRFDGTVDIAFRALAAALVTFGFSLQATAAPHLGDSTSAMAKQTIVYRIDIHRVSDLNFGEASPGDGPKTVAPGTTETRENASFEVVGEPLRIFQIILPAKNSVRMISGAGGPNREISIREFASTPSQVGILDSNGKNMIFVGATRESILQTQRPGEYSGPFQVTVVY